MTVLLVCANEDRLKRFKAAVLSVGFRTISAHGLDEAWTRDDSFDFSAVVIDYALKNDIAASAFRQRYIILNLNEGSALGAMVMELTPRIPCKIRIAATVPGGV